DHDDMMQGSPRLAGPRIDDDHRLHWILDTGLTAVTGRRRAGRSAGEDDEVTLVSRRVRCSDRRWDRERDHEVDRCRLGMNLIVPYRLVRSEQRRDCGGDQESSNNADIHVCSFPLREGGLWPVPRSDQFLPPGVLPDLSGTGPEGGPLIASPPRSH